LELAKRRFVSGVLKAKGRAIFAPVKN